MRIESVQIKNYRNLDNISVKLHLGSSYIIGENNLGKSNFLELLEIICDGKSFSDADYCDEFQPIEVLLSLKLLDEEKGFFGDNFSPDNSNNIKLKISQDIKDAYPAVMCVNTGESIPLKYLRKIHFLKYNTTMNPGKELRFDGKGGASLLLGNIIKRYIGKEGSASFLDDVQMAQLTSFINEHLSKIHSFNDYSVKASIATKLEELLSRMFYLSTDDRKIEDAGSGIQYLAMASINVLCQIMDIFRGKAIPFEEHLYSDGEGKKYLPLVLAIDEPEVHLHPFLQRALIRYYKRILCNNDEDFVSLLNMCFGIDGINGQLVLVTHSTDALIEDYRNIVRFYHDNAIIKVMSGVDIRLTASEEKQMLMNFPELKETFYSRCVLLVEGETEYGCMKAFADTIGINFDDCGISLINAGGEKNIPPTRKLLRMFGIPSVAIYDNDVNHGNSDPHEFYTSELCYEIEIVKTLYAAGEINILKEIVNQSEGSGIELCLDKDYVGKWYKKARLDINSFTPIKMCDLSTDNVSLFCNVYAAWLYAKKSILLGRIIGQLLDESMIPNSYKSVIRKAKEVAENV